MERLDIDRSKLESVLLQRFIISPSFQQYGGSSGLYDYGPPGTAIKNNMIKLWRDHFLFTGDIYEIESTCITPYDVLKASGHVEKFHDFMISDNTTGECYRADHLVRDYLMKHAKKGDADAINLMHNIDSFNKEELQGIINKYNIRSPNGNILGEIRDFNMMFETNIGPMNKNPGLLRPETAQGIFLNFNKLLAYNNNRLPFGGCQIGSAFRNEVSPRSGLLRLREFHLAEIEYFYHPNENTHSGFNEIKMIVINLITKNGDNLNITIEDAYNKGIIQNQILAYFIGRAHSFVYKCGFQMDMVRWRQHGVKEMAHYARDCFDCEILSTYGWIECIGIADRSCYDLSHHKIEYFEQFTEPKKIKVIDMVIDKKEIGMTFKDNSKMLLAYLSNMDSGKIEWLHQCLKKNNYVKLELNKDDIFDITNKMIQFKEIEKKITGTCITPHVIEPSFGIDRLVYILMEHNFKVREVDSNRTILNLDPILAPYLCAILSVVDCSEQKEYLQRIHNILNTAKITNRIDSSSVSIGKRYSRMDEIGVAFCITVDSDTPKDNQVTLRNAVSMGQIRVLIDDLVQKINSLLVGDLFI